MLVSMGGVEFLQEVCVCVCACVCVWQVWQGKYGFSLPYKIPHFQSIKLVFNPLSGLLGSSQIFIQTSLASLIKDIRKTGHYSDPHPPPP